MKIRHTLQVLILFCYVLVYFNGAHLIAQEKQIQYKLKVEVKLLYVLALDKEGNPVTDLQKEDFTLFVDGQPQEIESFSLVSHIAEGAEAEQEEFAAERLDIQDISPEEPKLNKRFILAALPYSYESLAHLHRAKRAIINLIENARYPEDWIAIVVIHRDWISTIQDFTCSKEKLLQKFYSYFNMDKKKLNSLESQYLVTAEEIYQVPQLPIFQGFIPISGGMDIIPALEHIAEMMGILEGRKIILCFGLPVGFLGDASLRLWSTLEMINKMLSNNITMYYIELERPDAYSGSGDIFEHAALESSHFALANETGGKYYHNAINPTYCVDDVDKINSSYYLISFTITEELRKKKSHTIRLECKRKGVKLFYGNKYYAPDELEEKKFEEIYKRTQLYKYLFLDIEQPDLKIYGQWIPLPTDEEQLHLGVLDFYLPAELFQSLPVSYQLGCSYSNPQEKGIIFENEISFSPSKKDKSSVPHGYVVRVFAKMPEGNKSLRLVAMNDETGEYGKYDIDISKALERTDFSTILLGRLLEEGPFYECREYSEARFNLKKELYNLLSINDSLIIPSVNNTFRPGEQVAFCLIRKIPPEPSTRYEKVTASLSLIGNDEAIKIELPILRKNVDKNYRQYYGIINTADMKRGIYRLTVDVKKWDNSPVAEMAADLEIVP